MTVLFDAMTDSRTALQDCNVAPRLFRLFA